MATLLVAAIAAGDASADDDAAGESSAVPAPVEAPAPPRGRAQPPRLRGDAAVPYPPDALARGESGRVVLRLDVDAAGRVEDAVVLEGASPSLEEAARTAALGLQFDPATRDGVPMRSRVLHAIDFALPLTSSSIARVGPPPSPPPGGPAAAARGDAGAAAVDVTVRGASEADRLRASARAVQVVETERARREAADLGEVLARAQGVGVRRAGGLGSGARFSLHGLTDDQVRFFLDGVPLEVAGYPFGIANVPVNLVDRVEVYRGVVPIHLGADALGGAVDVVTPQRLEGLHGAASYQVGSFGTHRVTAGGHHVDPGSGFFTRAELFVDHADNDFPVQVEVPSQRPETRGRLVETTAYRFHDGYDAAGGAVEMGFVRRPWARRLSLRVFRTAFDKELQNNPTMSLPYGEVEYGRRGVGVIGRWEHRPARDLDVAIVGGLSLLTTSFRDRSPCIYDWFGQCNRARQRPGELGTERDDAITDHTGFLRANGTWRLHPRHALRLSVAPTLVVRRGEDRVREVSFATADRDLRSLVGGLEHEVDLGDDRLENIAFAKVYLQDAVSDEPVSVDTRRTLERGGARAGVGDSARLRLTDALLAKASYEYATRLPRADEIFGDGVLTNENLDLAPEVSHNVNLGVALDVPETAIGALRAEVHGFLREARDLIVVLPAFGDRFRNENVFGARSIGADVAAGWSSPGEHVIVDANATYVDLRNILGEGPFAPFEGDRIPNRPYLYANASAQIGSATPFAADDRLSFTWHTRYVHEFFAFWESAGRTDSKLTIPSQLIHAVAWTYLVRRDETSFAITGEIDNLTDEQAFDFFGAQRPGRAVFVKTTAEF